MTGRQSTRPTPRQFTAGPDGHVFTVAPLPWRKRNDLGNYINESYLESLTQAMSAFDAEGNRIPGTKIQLREALFDYDGCLKLAFPNEDPADLEKLDIFELRELLCVACEVNGLDSLKSMIDPNLASPQPQEVEGEAPTDGQKTTSSEGSGDSEATP